MARASARDRVVRNADIVYFWVLGTGIIVLLSVAAVAFVLRKQLVRPLQRLAGQVRAVSRGDFEREVSGVGRARGGGPRRRRRRDARADRGRARSASPAPRADLKRSNAELEQFAYVASHDLQEPLRKVASFCQLLQQRYGGQLDARADQYIGFAVDGARRMQDLINDLLAFSRIGRFEQPATEVDCDVLMTRVRADLGRAIEESGAEIVSGPLPTVMGDASLLRVVFQNLCANAIKFRGEAAPIVHVDAERDGDCWRFRCADNGIGIDPEYEERIFVLFQRLHPRTEFEGTGIGLAMCRKIVEYHGGRMWLDTAAERKRRRLYLLLHPARRTGELMTDDDTKPISVLLVEDDPGDVVLIEEAFEHNKVRNSLKVVGDGVEAMEYLRSSDGDRPDLVLLDLNLPRKDGREVLAEIKSDPELRSIPVVVLTTSKAEEDILRSYDLHANAYVTKPVDFNRFIEVVRQIDEFFVTVVKLPQHRSPSG